jgi:2-aminoethylphosphonate-pyruvate transaminase
VSALAAALLALRQEGRAQRHARYADNMRRLVHGLERLGFHFLLSAEQRGDILVAVREPDEPWYSFATLHAALRARGFTIYPGKPGPQRTFRLSVLGDLHARDIERLLVELEGYVTRMRSAQQ